MLDCGIVQLVLGVVCDGGAWLKRSKVDSWYCWGHQTQTFPCHHLANSLIYVRISLIEGQESKFKKWWVGGLWLLCAREMHG